MKTKFNNPTTLKSGKKYFCRFERVVSLQGAVMKKFTCDICHKETDEYSLGKLYEKYRPEGVEHICSDCDKELTNAKRAMDKAVESLKDNWIKKIIDKMITKATQSN